MGLLPHALHDPRHGSRVTSDTGGAVRKPSPFPRRRTPAMTPAPGRPRCWHRRPRRGWASSPLGGDYSWRRLWRTPEGVPPQPAQAAGLPAGREWGGGRGPNTTGSLASRVLLFRSAETRPPAPCPLPPGGQTPWRARRPMSVRQIKQWTGGLYEAPRATFWPIQRAAPTKRGPGVRRGDEAAPGITVRQRRHGLQRARTVCLTGALDELLRPGGRLVASRCRFCAFAPLGASRDSAVLRNAPAGGGPRALEAARYPRGRTGSS
jgi:hypothetical protein